MVEFKRKSLELLYDAKIVALYKDVLETPDGGEVVYDLIKHKSGGGAGILLVDEEEYTYLVRQYRNSLDAVDLEIPAGDIASMENPVRHVRYGKQRRRLDGFRRISIM